MRSKGVIIVMTATGLLVFLAFVIPPDYEGSCAPFSYDESRSSRWGSIPCKRGVINQCAESHGQSPINLETSDENQDATEDGDVSMVVVVDEGSCHDLTVVSNQLHYDAQQSCGPSISLASQEYRLLQIHFHVGGSEHTIDDARFGGEIHLVHRGEAGSIAVVGVLLDTSQDEENEELEQLLELLYEEAGRRLENDGNAWNPYNLVPSLDTYFAYKGSLTTPPCTSGIRWIVVQEPLVLSENQLQRLEGLSPSIPTYRPVQARAGRKVVLYSSNNEG